jgi:hypothetical protein
MLTAVLCDAHSCFTNRRMEVPPWFSPAPDYSKPNKWDLQVRVHLGAACIWTCLLAFSPYVGVLEMQQPFNVHLARWYPGLKFRPQSLARAEELLTVDWHVPRDCDHDLGLGMRQGTWRHPAGAGFDNRRMAGYYALTTTKRGIGDAVRAVTHVALQPDLVVLHLYFRSSDSFC